MITLVAVGDVVPSILADLQPMLERVFETDVQMNGVVPVPERALNTRRNQYCSPVLLSNLPPPARLDDKVLGVTDVDIFTSNLNFIFGQAEVGGGRALISLRRLRPEYYHLTPNESLFRERVLKEAVHELGHTLGLGHCPHPSCVMHFSTFLGETDTKGWEFCPFCCARQPGRG